MSNKKDLSNKYDARHRLPADGCVRGNDGRVWHAKNGGQYWHTEEAGQEALSTAKLAEEHGPLIIVRPIPLPSALSKKAPRG